MRSSSSEEVAIELYYAYENWTARAYSAHDVKVHLQECPHCPFDAEGERTGPEPSGANDRWHRLGMYESPRDAMCRARELVPNGIEFRYCGNCLRGANEN